MPAMKPIGPQVRLRELRKAHGLTIEQLASRIAEFGVTVHPDSISNIENGNKKASTALLTAWAKALGVPPLDTWQPEPARKPASVRQSA